MTDGLCLNVKVNPRLCLSDQDVTAKAQRVGLLCIRGRLTASAGEAKGPSHENLTLYIDDL